MEGSKIPRCMCTLQKQPCQNVPAAGNFAAFIPFLVAYSTLDFTMSSLAGKGTWCLLRTTPSMLPTAIKHFERAAKEERAEGVQATHCMGSEREQFM